MGPSISQAHCVFGGFFVLTDHTHFQPQGCITARLGAELSVDAPDLLRGKSLNELF